MINSKLEWSPSAGTQSNPGNGSSKPTNEHQTNGTMTILTPTPVDYSHQYRIIAPSETFRRTAYIRHPEEYERLYRLSIQDPSTFWYEIGKEFYWKQFPKRDDVLKYNFDMKKGPIFTKWFLNSTTNICYNALDRHIINGFGSKIAYHWYVPAYTFLLYLH